MFSKKCNIKMKKSLPFFFKESRLFETKPSLFLKEQKNEEGSMLIDEMASLLVMVFVFVMVLVYISYTQMIQTKMVIDNKAKEYLYAMEEEGYLTTTLKNEMKSELEALGCNVVSFTGTTVTQVEYGKGIKLYCKVTFPNPLYKNLSSEKHGGGIFTMIGLTDTITYEIKMSSTSKW